MNQTFKHQAISEFLVKRVLTRVPFVNYSVTDAFVSEEIGEDNINFAFKIIVSDVEKNHQDEIFIEVDTFLDSALFYMTEDKRTSTHAYNYPYTSVLENGYELLIKNILDKKIA